jgi:acetylornithine/succinyldiaminopimelate/putrescine aminotransferase
MPTPIRFTAGERPPTPINMNDQLRIIRAENDLLFDEAGRSYIDLFSAHGTAWLGHAPHRVAAAVAAQLQAVWNIGGLGFPLFTRACELVDSFFPPSHGLCALYSTGMEAAEFSIRFARVVTGRRGAIGFQRSMHGKSLATSILTWDNRDGMQVPDFIRLPFVGECGESAILERLTAQLAKGTIGAVLVEPLQGSGGGHMASPGFYRELQRLCTAQGALLIFDEILTGFFRTGTPFFFSELGFVPDVVLIGKAVGSGFPVAGVVALRRHPVSEAMLRGSTFAGNPLACAALVATLEEIGRRDLRALVAAIEQTIVAILGPLKDGGVAVRGKGALWVLELPSATDTRALVKRIYLQGVCVGYTGRQIRVLPAAIIAPGRLAQACVTVRDAVNWACHDASATG